MKTVRTWSVTSLAVLVAATSLGCGGSSDDDGRKKAVPATGTITYKGNAVEGAEVAFRPNIPPPPPGKTNVMSDAKGAVARTDASGKFTLTTYATGDGAIPGDYFVTVTKWEGPPPSTITSNEDPAYDPDAAEAESTPPAKNLLPEKYAQERTSGLTATVTEDGPNDFAFDLTD
ncbi:MAG TPA: hypothetical protein VML55_05070 [Planctomycetaceae bacterium]|nr:hypothetical protein [Planctomycetaceae bacterium]